MTTHESAQDEAADGKSIADLRILCADTGFETSLAEIQGRGERPPVWSVDERLRLCKAQLTNRVAVTRQTAHSLRLASGRQLAVGSTYRLRKVDGWTSAADLAPGARIAVLRRVGEPTRVVPMPEPELILLAHMIGDGSCIKRQPVRYASIDEANLEAVTNAAAYFGVTPIRDEYPAARVTTLRLPAPYRLTHGKRNPIAEWLDRLGLFGLRSYEKFVPATVFATSDEQVALFLRHLWATDGSVRWDAKTAQGRVYYASTSRRLIDDVMQLLLRVGVQGRITQVRKAGYRDCWHLTIDRADNQLAFLTKVGVHGERGIKAQEVIAQLAGRVRRPGTDTIPVEIWDHVKGIMQQRNWTDKDFSVATNTRFDGELMWTHAPGRARVHRLSTIFADSLLHDLATNDIYWDKVISVVRGKPRDLLELSDAMNNPVVMQGVVVVLPPSNC